MNRKMVGIFTAVAAALLLVGVAWASSDSGRDDAGSSSTQVSPTSDVSSPGGPTGDVTGTSVDDRLTRSGGDDNGGSTPTTIDDNGGSTPATIDDNGGDRDNSGSDNSGSDNSGSDNGGSDDNGGDRDD